MDEEERRPRPPGEFDECDVPGYLAWVADAPGDRAAAIRARIARGPEHLARERGRARAAGVALTPAELERPEPPPERNAAEEYLTLTSLRGERLFSDADREQLDRFGFTRPLSAELLPEARGFLAAHADVLDLLQQATGKPECVIPHAGESDPPYLFPGLTSSRDLARLLRVESAVLSAEGRLGEAVATQARVLQLVRHLDSDPRQRDLMLGIVVAAVGIAGLAALLHEREPNAGIAGHVERACVEGRDALHLPGYYRGWMAVRDADRLRAGGPAALCEGINPDMSEPDIEWDRPPLVSAALTPEQSGVWNDLIDAAEARFLHQALASLSAAEGPPEDLVDRLAALAAEPEGVDDPVDYIGGWFASTLPMVGMNYCHHLARLDALRAGAAVLAYRAGEGRFPEWLEDAVPDPPLDPFDGQALKYRSESGAFIVYSVGQDRAFDGKNTQTVLPGKLDYFCYPADFVARPRSPWR